MKSYNLVYIKTSYSNSVYTHWCRYRSGIPLWPQATGPPFDTKTALKHGLHWSPEGMLYLQQDSSNRSFKFWKLRGGASELLNLKHVVVLFKPVLKHVCVAERGHSYRGHVFLLLRGSVLMLMCPFSVLSWMDRGQHGHPDWSAAMLPHALHMTLLLVHHCFSTCL